MYSNIIKPFLDFCFAISGFLLLTPIFVIIAWGLSLSIRGNPFFLQKRPGKDEKIFTLIKFKTMTDEKDEQGNLLPDSERLTSFGKFIRSTSMDEIPQLINVIKGDMSLVGPRPLLVRYLDRYSPEQARRHKVKPGITGWAQVNGRNAISWEKKFELDVEYVNNVSFLFDVKILYYTIIRVIKREGIASVNSDTMEEFKPK